MTNIKRKSWTEDESKLLIESWDKIGSISLLSLILKRSPSSIQTQASRIGLPRRTETLQRHRRRWSEEEEFDLLEQLKIETDLNGQIKIENIASSLNRSVDAIIAKLSDEYIDANELIKRIIINNCSVETLISNKNETNVEIDPYTKRKKVSDERTKSKMRNCMTCRKPFWSEGAHNRICERCKNSYDSEDWYGGY